MPPSEPPDLERAPASFHPSMLARSVIALPLLAEIEEEQATRADFEKNHPRVREKYNAAIFLHEKFPDGPDAAYRHLNKLLKETLKDLKETDCVIDPPPPTGPSFCLARLTGPVARQLTGRDAERLPVAIARIWPTLHDVIIEVNLDFRAGEKVIEPFRPKDETWEPTLDARVIAQRLIMEAVKEAIAQEMPIEPPVFAGDAAAPKLVPPLDQNQAVDTAKTRLSAQYVFARLEGRTVQRLVEIDTDRAAKMARAEAELRNADRPKEKPAKGKKKKPQSAVEAAPEEYVEPFRTIYHIWPDFAIRGCITRSIATVKADAAHRSFTALGDKITWAVMDSGIAADHPHFQLHQNIDLHSTAHADFSAPNANSPLTDAFGHGTHVAGIIAGAQTTQSAKLPTDLTVAYPERNSQTGKPVTKLDTLTAISGIAPKCRLVSLKVLDEFGQGNVSNLIAAIGHIQQINGHGREIHIQGVNISLGYPFDPKWFACGRSPLCVEVNRLVRSGVVVVVAAGNTGYGTLQTAEGKSDACLDLTINDPGNAEYAITVGSTHRDMPHVYGVSFFSSKGPTGDGRLKPDLLAPGERIISCAAGKLREHEASGSACSYLETSGTSMAAPHVSGAIAAFLSIRREFIGDTDRVKAIFKAAATDLGRDRNFQGAGLVDLMRAIQSV